MLESLKAGDQLPSQTRRVDIFPGYTPVKILYNSYRLHSFPSESLLIFELNNDISR